MLFGFRVPSFPAEPQMVSVERSALRTAQPLQSGRWNPLTPGTRNPEPETRNPELETRQPAFALAPRAQAVNNELHSMKLLRQILAVSGAAFLLAGSLPAADNSLTDAERRQGWLLLFDGRTTNGWMNSDRTPPRTPVINGELSPYKAGHYMLVHTQQWTDFVLSLDFKISKGCNSGVFVRTQSLTPRPGRDVGFNGLEIAIDDTPGAGFHDTGAVYDLVKPLRNAMRPVGDWNHMEISCISNRVDVVLNGDAVTRADLDQFVEPSRRPDGSAHKFDEAFKDHPRRGYIGLQDHGSPCWFKNIKLKPLP